MERYIATQLLFIPQIFLQGIAENGQHPGEERGRSEKDTGERPFFSSQQERQETISKKKKPDSVFRRQVVYGSG